MKYTVILIGFLFVPSFALAAPLTQDQANSLIAVVQSSPTTPASAFTNLITAFSSITVPQAESLISVIQQAPGVPADAFVGMLLAFTVDPVQSVAPVLGSTQPVVDNTQPALVVQSPVVEKKLTLDRIAASSSPHFKGMGLKSGILFVIVADYRENGKRVSGVPITLTAPSGNILSPAWNGSPDDIPALTVTKNTNGERGTSFDYSPNPEDKENKIILTATANGETATITVWAKYL